jgi:predicted phage terminase large subunit-like protein
MDATIIQPQPGPQTRFLTTPADIAIYGGSAGGGKTFAELIEALRHVSVPRFNAVIFRRSSEQIRQSGGLWEAAQEVYSKFGAKSREQQLDFRFSSGATIKLDSLIHEKTKEEYQGAEIALIEFDELTHFTESQFFYLLSRNRSTCGVRPYVRATTNPDANSWVKGFLSPWLRKDFAGYGGPAESGEIRWFVRDGGAILWVPEGTPDAKSVTFVRASIYDNKILLAKDPGYLANLKAMSLVDRKRLLDGDWDIVEGGNFFRREWFEIVSATPKIGQRVRFWDLAATEVKPGKDPDWTVGYLMNYSDGAFFVEDVQRVRTTPKQVENLIVQTATIDGRSVRVRMEQEPGSSGVIVIDYYTRVLAGWDFKGVRSTGDKAERAKPYSAQAEAGNVKLKEGPWNNDFLNEHAAFPNPEIHDDQVDGGSGALFELTQPRQNELL